MKNTLLIAALFLFSSFTAQATTPVEQFKDYFLEVDQFQVKVIENGANDILEVTYPLQCAVSLKEVYIHELPTYHGAQTVAYKVAVELTKNLYVRCFWANDRMETAQFKLDNHGLQAMVSKFKPEKEPKKQQTFDVGFYASMVFAHSDYAKVLDRIHQIHNGHIELRKVVVTDVNSTEQLIEIHVWEGQPTPGRWGMEYTNVGFIRAEVIAISDAPKRITNMEYAVYTKHGEN